MNISTLLHSPAARKSRSIPMFFLLMLSFVFLASNLHAADVSLSWNKNDEADLAGYKVYQRLLPTNEYGSAVFSGLPSNPAAPQITITNLLASRTYGFIATACDTSGNESSTSNESIVTTSGGGSGNQAPTVSAGPNQTITLPSHAALNGTVSDDGLPTPPAAVTTTWSKVSGPGTVSFGNASVVNTTASFSGAGVYLLRLTANDSASTSSDDLTITVNPAGGSGGGGSVTITNLLPSSYAGVPSSPGLQVGSRVYIDRSYTFTTVPASVQGAAYIQTANNDKASTANPFLSFTVDQPVTVYVAYDARLPLPLWLTNMGFTDTGENLGTTDSPRDLFAQTFPAGPITLGGNESAGGSMYSVIVQATNGSGPSNQAPTVSAGPNQTITLPSHAALNGTVSDDGLPTPPATVTTTWSKVSGPGTVSFGNASVVNTTASFSGAGVYLLRLTANDSASTSSDDLTITVNPAGPSNQAPTVSAGPNQTITLPSHAALNGTVSDDGLPTPPATVTTTWSKVSGPGTVSFGNASVVNTTASFSGAGVYLLRLTANDSASTSSDDLTITVNPAGGSGGGGSVTITNLLPSSYAGVPSSPGLQVGSRVYIDRSYTFTTVPASVQGAAYIQTANNDKASTANPFLSFTVDQPVTVYVAYDARLPLPLWLTNMGFTDTGENLGTTDSPRDLFAQTFPAGPITLGGNESAGGSMYSVIVQATNGSGPSNQAPTVSAGPNQTITLPSHAALNGTVSDDGLPTPPATVTTTWSKVSGPGTVSFGNASVVATTASFSGAGVYLLRLTANDSASTSSDDLTITVNPAGPSNQAPTVSAGPNQTITLPSHAALNGTVSDDGLPTPPATVTTTWSKVSGPGTVSFGNASVVATTASFSGAGVYLLRLTANDSASTSSDDLTITVNPAGGSGGGGSVTITNLLPSSYAGVPSSPGLQVGSRVYIDRSYTFTTVPASVQGAAYIQTANNDKASTANPFLSFTVDQPVTVYVAYDARLPLPLWLTNMGFTDTGENLGTTDTPRDLFAQTFPTGPISLGGNENGGSMYSVIVQTSGPGS